MLQVRSWLHRKGNVRYEIVNAALLKSLFCTGELQLYVDSVLARICLCSIRSEKNAVAVL